MQFRNLLLSLAMGTMAIAASPSAEAFTDVIVGPFSDACAKGSGSIEVTGGIWEFANYLASTTDGACYMGNLKLSNFGDFSVLIASEASVLIRNMPSFDLPDFSSARIAVYSGWSLLGGVGFDYTVTGWSGGNTPFASLAQWSASNVGVSEYEVTTKATPSLDPACAPAVVTSAPSPQGPACNTPPGVVLEELSVTNFLSDTMFSDSMEGTAIINDFVVANTLPPPGTDPINPFLPSPPQGISEPWVFDPVVVNDPGQVWWFDPEVSIGYIYNVADPLGPLFDQYTAPDLPFNDTYELLSSGGAACGTNPEDFTTSLATITQNVPYDFTTPLACFAIKGISEQNALDPLNTTAFVAGISFDKAGTVTVSQTPIPTPGPLPLAGAGMAYGWARGLRRRLRLRAQAAGG